jgi:hypothetical protein
VSTVSAKAMALSCSVLFHPKQRKGHFLSQSWPGPDSVSWPAWPFHSFSTVEKLRRQCAGHWQDCTMSTISVNKNYQEG